MNKDFSLILQLAAGVDAVMPATSAAFQINSEAMAADADQDFSVVMKVMEHRTAKAPAARSTAG
jgi:3-hydroxyisobutyrate dehydrogenase-like beta-hydroxyacid dehydrogenase